MESAIDHIIVFKVCVQATGMITIDNDDDDNDNDDVGADDDNDLNDNNH